MEPEAPGFESSLKGDEHIDICTSKFQLKEYSSNIECSNLP